MNNFRNKGGEFIQVNNLLNKSDITSLKKCFISTAENSVFYLPYQDIYLNSALTTSATNLKNVYYFLAKLKGEFIGYQAVIKTGGNLNALHGAFDRNLKTTYHAYDILFVKLTEFAIANKLKSIDFGSVINVTKQRMVNKTKNMSYFLFSKYLIVQKIFNIFLGITKIQGKEQMKFQKNQT